MDGAEYLLSLGDNITGPAVSMLRSLEALQQASIRTAIAEERLSQVQTGGAMRLAAQEAKIAADADMRAAMNKEKLAQAQNKTTTAAFKAAQQHRAAEDKIAQAAEQSAARVQAAHAKATADQARAALANIKAAAVAQKMQQKQKETETATTDLGKSFSDLAQQGTQVDGVMGKVQSVLAKLGPEGEVAAAALGVLTIAITATVGTLLALSATAIEVTQHLGLMSARFAALAGSAAGGRAVTEMVQRLSASLPFATSQIEQWASALQRAGIAGKDLEAATRAVAAAAAINPEGGAQAAQDLLSKLASGGKEATDLIKAIAEGGRRGMGPLRELGLTVADLGGKAAVAKMSAQELSKAIEKALQKKGKGPLEEMALSWPNIIQKAKEGFMSLFGDLGPAVKPFMQAVKSLFGEFTKGGNTTKILKPIVTSVFSTLFNWATKAVNFIHKGFQMIEIAALRIYIAVHPAINAMKKLAANESFIRGLKVALILLAIPFIVLAVVIFGAIIAFGLLIAIVGAVVYGFVWLVGAIVGVVADIADAIGQMASDAYDAGSNFVSSLADSIMGGISDVIASAASLGSAAKDALFSALGIHSPSRVALEAATNVTDTFSGTVEDGAGDADEAMSRLGAGPIGGGKAGEGGKGGKGRGGVHIGTLNLYGSSAQDLWNQLAELLARAQDEGPTPEGAS